MSDIPADANESCPGTDSERAGKTNACAGCPNQQACSTGVKPVDPDIEFIRDRLRNVKHKILVLSGKGGVGKSTVTTNLALALASDRRVATSAGGGDEPVTGPLQVGVLDVDICGPSQARMFGCEGESVHDSADGWSPVYVADNLGVMSIAFLMDGRDEAVIWRGPRKNALIKQFLRNVDWGNVDYLLIDTPPGTSDEHISIVQLLLDASTIDGAIVVTTPQEVSLLDVRKEINFCRKTHVPILGVVENMSRFICPCCSTATALFPSTTGGAMRMCAELDLPLLAQLPHDPRMAECVDGGESYADAFGASAPLTTAFDALAAAVVSRCAAGDHSGQSTSSEQ